MTTEEFNTIITSPLAMASSFRFIGELDTLSEARSFRNGDICICNGCEYAYIKGMGWEELGRCDSPREENKPKYTKITYPTNCKNCGAVMKSCTCEYCGTTYTGYEESKLDKPKYDSKLITAAAISLAKQNNDPLYDELVNSYHKKKDFMKYLRYKYEI